MKRTEMSGPCIATNCKCSMSIADIRNNRIQYKHQINVFTSDLIWLVSTGSHHFCDIQQFASTIPMSAVLHTFMVDYSKVDFAFKFWIFRLYCADGV